MNVYRSRLAIEVENANSNINLVQSECKDCADFSKLRGKQDAGRLRGSDERFVRQTGTQ